MKPVFVAIIIATSISCSIGSSRADIEFPLPYQGQRHPQATIEAVRSRIEPMVPIAIDQAQSLLDLTLDHKRISLVILDISPGKKKINWRMATFGVEAPVVGLFVEPLMRGSFSGDPDVQRTLTHEVMHALVRQNIPHDDYAQLSEWFQEGIPHYLLELGDKKMTSAIALAWENPLTSLQGFEGDHSAKPEITGYFVMAELDSRLGPGGLQTFIKDVLREGSVDAALANLPVTAHHGLWHAAGQRAQAHFEGIMGQVGEKFRNCMIHYRKGTNRGADAVTCFQELIDESPDTYAAEISRYWLAKCFFRRRQLEEAQEYFSRFEKGNNHFGLLDNLKYFQLRILLEIGPEPEVPQACEHYLTYFPDGDDFIKVVEYCDDRSED